MQAQAHQAGGRRTSPHGRVTSRACGQGQSLDSEPSRIELSAAEGFGERIGERQVWVFVKFGFFGPVHNLTLGFLVRRLSRAPVQKSVRGKSRKTCVKFLMKGLILVGGLGTQV